MDIAAGDLLMDEQVVSTKRANSVVQYTEHGLQRVAALHAGLEALGWGGKEAVGGKVHLTNFRLLFKAHKMNRLTGTFSIFLPSIQSVRNSGRGLKRGMTVTTAAQELEFVVWGADSLIAAVEERRQAVALDRLDHAVRAAAGNPSALGLGLVKSDFVDKLLRGGALSKIVTNVGEIAADPFSLSTVVNMVEIAELLQQE